MDSSSIGLKTGPMQHTAEVGTGNVDGIELGTQIGQDPMGKSMGGSLGGTLYLGIGGRGRYPFLYDRFQCFSFFPRQ